jgi:hypothetical protein
MTRIGTAVMSLVLALGVVVGLDAAPAQAKTMNVWLTIDTKPKPHGEYMVTMHVWLPMNDYDAYGYYVNGARLQVAFWADDTFFDALLAPFDGGTKAGQTWVAFSPGYTAEHDGIHLRWVFLVPGRVLDEDPSGIFGNLQDEIYYTATFIDGDGVVDKVRSNVAKGYFCCG